MLSIYIYRKGTQEDLYYFDEKLSSEDNNSDDEMKDNKIDKENKENIPNNKLSKALANNKTTQILLI